MWPASFRETKAADKKELKIAKPWWKIGEKTRENPGGKKMGSKKEPKGAPPPARPAGIRLCSGTGLLVLGAVTCLLFATVWGQQDSRYRNNGRNNNKEKIPYSQ